MFQNDRYITCGVENEIPAPIQLAMWCMIDNRRLTGAKVDYLQVFRLSGQDGRQKIIHSQEQPDYRNEVIIPTLNHPVEAKIFVIDDGDHSTMLLSDEY